MRSKGRADAAADIEQARQSLLMPRHLLFTLGALLFVLTCAFEAGQVNAAPADPLTDYIHTPAEIQRAEENDPPQQTDPKAALELPHRDLDRDEALELIQGVFGALLNAPAGIFTDLNVEKFISDNVALIPETEFPDPADSSQPEAEDSILLDSTVPLRAKTESGQERSVDLGLQQADGELHPTNPIVDVGIPMQLGEGINLPDSRVQIDIAGAPLERAPSTVEESVAFYPNIAEDTDLAVSPTPIGVETLTQLRSIDSPHSQTFDIGLPNGAFLQKTTDGGAEATLEERPILRILPPSALDARGETVATNLSVSADSITVSITPDSSTSFPVILDPIFDTYDWYTGQTTYNGWTSYRTPIATAWNTYTEPEYGCSTYCYLKVGANAGGWTYTNAQTYWNYLVPRFTQDYNAGKGRPTSWVQAFTVGSLVFSGNGDYQPNPQMLIATANEVGAWQTANMWPPNTTGAYGIDLGTNHAAKMASFGMFATSDNYLNAYRYVLAGYAQVGLGDSDSPSFGSITGPTHWVNNKPDVFNVTVSDPGLGVASLQVNAPGGGPILGTTQVKNGSNACLGTAGSPCPRTWQGAQAGNLINYDPTSLAQGTNYLNLTASDPLGNKSSAATFPVKVDHTTPVLSTSGSLTEQTKLGPTLPSYTIALKATDGSAEQPQSGIAKTVIKVDGKVEKEATCTTTSCAISDEWSMSSVKYSVGKHFVEAIAWDSVGLSTSKSFMIEIQRDKLQPVLTLSGELADAPEGWVQQKNYLLSVKATDVKGFGITSLVFKIDGKTVKSITKTCGQGSCEAVMIPTINMATYAGGTHSAEVIATDGAANTTKNLWTINVDPSGQISNAEAGDTLEAVEVTSEETLVGPNDGLIDPAEIAEGNNPDIVQNEGDFESTGTGVGTTIATNTEEGFTVHASEGTIHVQPVETPVAPTPATEAGDVGVISGNTSNGVDTVFRPIFDGLMTFTSIRDASAPETYSWEVELAPGQTLVSIDESNAVVYYDDGVEAMSIRTEAAHDATGKAVPTSLSVSEKNILTLRVRHVEQPFVYPVVAGPGWQAGYETIIVLPVTEKPKTELEEAERIIKNSAIYESISAPEPVGNGDDFDASASSVPTYRRHYEYDQCEELTFPIPGCSVWDQEISGFYYYNGRYAWWKKEQARPQCPHSVGPGISISTNFCDFAGPNHQKYGDGYHITSQVFFDVSYVAKGPLTFGHAITVRMFGSGGVHAHKDETCICNPSTPGK